MTRRLMVAAALLLGAATEARGNEHLARARQEIAAIELERAAASLERALEQGDGEPATIAEIYLLGGQVAAALGDREDAIRRFVAALSLRPESDLVGVAPKVSEPFAKARRLQRAAGPLRIRQQVNRARRTLLVEVVADPATLVAEARLTEVRSRRVVRAEGSGGFALPLPGAGRLEVVASVHDRFGNRLAVLGSDEVPLVIDPEQPSAPPATLTAGPEAEPAAAESRSLFGRWYLWAGASAVAAGTGAVFALLAGRASDDLDALNQASEDHQFEEAQAVEDRWRQRALIANVSFGVAAGLGVVSAILLITAADDAPSRTTISLSPLSGGAAAHLGFAF